jgi:para-nitrobenzyl esterase
LSSPSTIALISGFAVTRQEGGLALANNGFRDQREGLRWVRNHIAAFGGDPANVMIFGESAGGQSVATHVVSVGSGKLFDAAIAESGDILNVLNLSDAQQKTRDLATDLGCHRSSAREELACMQAARVEDILRLTNSTGPGAVIDMDILQAHPLTLIEQGNFNKVPFTLGSNKDEGNLFVYPPLAETAPATASDIRCAVKKTFGEKVGEKVLQVYPAVDEAGVDNRLIASQIFGAVTFHCDNRRVAQALSKAGVAPWLYSFNRQSSCSVFQGATHGAEISYVFGNPHASFLNNTACEVSSLDIALSNKVSGMWANFSRTHRMDERWTRFESPAREVNLKIDLSLVDTFDLEYSAHRSECDVLKRIGVFNDTGTPTVLPADNIGANLAECQEAAQDKHALSMTVVV